MVWKYKVDEVHGTVTHKCWLCLCGDWQKEGVDFFKNKTYSAVLNCRENRVLCAFSCSKWLAYVYLRHNTSFLLMENLMYLYIVTRQKGFHVHLVKFSISMLVSTVRIKLQLFLESVD
jgi:hypothetical protein